MMLLFVAVAAVLPSLLLAWYFHSRDLRPEPSRVVWAVFGLGVASVVPVLVVAIPIGGLLGATLGHPFALGTGEAFLAAAIPEEFFKFLVLYLYAARHKDFDEPMDGIVYGVIASLGFATLENLLYSFQGGIGVAALRAFTAVPGHAFCGAIMGYFVGRARFGPPERRRAEITRALLWPMLLHGLYDTPLLTVKHWNEVGIAYHDAGAVLLLVLATLGVLVWEAIWAVKLVRRTRREQAELIRTEERRAAEAAEAAARAAAEAAAVAAERAAAGLEPIEVPLPAAVVPAGPGPLRVPGSAGEPPTPPLPAHLAPPPPSRPVAYLLLSLGALFASVGGLFTLGIVVSLLQGKVESEKVGSVIAGGLIIGALPLGLGLVLFGKGLRRLPKRVRASLVPGRTSLPPGALPPAPPPPRAVPPMG